jgi:hypothetical protein
MVYLPSLIVATYHVSTLSSFFLEAMKDSKDKEIKDSLPSSSSLRPDINTEEKGLHGSPEVAQNGETQDSNANRDPNSAGWEDSNDQENSMNWPERKKWGMAVLLASITISTLVFIFPPGVDQELKIRQVR